MLLRRDDEMLSCPLTFTGPSSYFELIDNEIMDQSATTMTNSTTSDFKCLQWNARGLTKSKLEEFRHFLSTVNPEIVMLSATQWSSESPLSLKPTTSSRKTAQNRMRGGGMALLIRKNLHFPQSISTRPATLKQSASASSAKTTSTLTFFPSTSQKPTTRPKKSKLS
jgi:hypothetical protein